MKKTKQDTIMDMILDLLQCHQHAKASKAEAKLFGDLVSYIESYPDKKELLIDLDGTLEEAIGVLLRYEVISDRILSLCEALEIDKHKKRHRALFDNVEALRHFHSHRRVMTDKPLATEQPNIMEQRVRLFFSANGEMSDKDFNELLASIRSYDDKRQLRKKLATYFDKHFWNVLVSTDALHIIERYFLLEHAFGKNEARIIKKKQRLDSDRAERAIVMLIESGCDPIFSSGRQDEMLFVNLLKWVHDCPKKKDLRQSLSKKMDKIRERAYHVESSYEKYRQLEHAFGAYKYMLDEWDKEQALICLDDVRDLNKRLNKSNGKRQRKAIELSLWQRMMSRGSQPVAKRR